MVALGMVTLGMVTLGMVLGADSVHCALQAELARVEYWGTLGEWIERESIPVREHLARVGRTLSNAQPAVLNSTLPLEVPLESFLAALAADSAAEPAPVPAAGFVGAAGNLRGSALGGAGTNAGGVSGTAAALARHRAATSASTRADTLTDSDTPSLDTPGSRTRTPGVRTWLPGQQVRQQVGISDRGAGALAAAQAAAAVTGSPLQVAGVAASAQAAAAEGQLNGAGSGVYVDFVGVCSPSIGTLLVQDLLIGCDYWPLLFLLIDCSDLRADA